MVLFNQSTERRGAILEDLRLHGMDVTNLKNLSLKIDAQHSEREHALLQNRDGVLVSIPSGLKLLNQQFRATVERCQLDLQAQLKASEWEP